MNSCRTCTRHDLERLSVNFTAKLLCSLLHVLYVEILGFGLILRATSDFALDMNLTISLT